jgi:hypothetical protein
VADLDVNVALAACSILGGGPRIDGGQKQYTGRFCNPILPQCRLGQGGALITVGEVHQRMFVGTVAIEARREAVHLAGQQKYLQGIESAGRRCRAHPPKPSVGNTLGRPENLRHVGQGEGPAGEGADGTARLKRRFHRKRALQLRIR